jgi:branched-chain amino acid transport system substrate-binding protein
MKKITSVFVVSCLFSFLVLFPFASPFVKEATAKAKTLKIGLITSVTGPMAPAFKPMFDAVRPTEDLINQRGGITVNGQKYNIDIIPEDDQSSPPGAIAAANKLMQEGVKFVIAPMFMPNNIAIASVTEEAKILRMKPFGSGPEEVNPQTRYSFYSSASLYNIEPCYDYLVKTYPQAKRIAIVMPDDPGAATHVILNKKAIKKHGLELVFEEAFKIPTEDFYPILTKALEHKPDAINCIVSIVPWAAGIINQSRELGFSGPIFSPGLFGDINLVNGIIDKKYANDIFHGGPDVLSDKMLPMVKDLRKLVEQAGNPYIMDSALPLDSLYLMLQAIEEAQSFDTDKVVDTIETMDNIDTIWGPGRWGGEDIVGINHVVLRPFTFSRIVNGKVEFEFIE